MPPLQTPGTAYTNPKCYREADAHGGALTPPYKPAGSSPPARRSTASMRLSTTGIENGLAM